MRSWIGSYVVTLLKYPLTKATWKPKEKKNSDIHMNTKLIHYDQCYYNEHKINSSQRNTQSTTHLLYLLTKNNRTIILHQGDTRGHGHCQHISHTKLFPSLGVYQDNFARRLFTNHSKAKAVKTWITNGVPDLCCSLPGLGLGWSTRSICNI